MAAPKPKKIDLALWIIRQEIMNNTYMPSAEKVAELSIQFLCNISKLFVTDTCKTP